MNPLSVDDREDVEVPGKIREGFEASSCFCSSIFPFFEFASNSFSTLKMLILLTF